MDFGDGEAVGGEIEGGGCRAHRLSRFSIGQDEPAGGSAGYRTKILVEPKQQRKHNDARPNEWSGAHFHRRNTECRATARNDRPSFLNIQHSMKSPVSESSSQAVGASIRTGLTADEIKQAFRDNLVCGMGRLEAVATKHDLYFALALTVRDRLFHRSRREHRKLRRSGRATRGLSLRGVPARAASREQSAQPRHHGSRARSDARARLRSRRDSCAGRGARPRQWRTGPARVVLHGFARVGRSARASATASATSSAFSIRSSATAGSARSPTNG